MNKALHKLRKPALINTLSIAFVFLTAIALSGNAHAQHVEAEPGQTITQIVAASGGEFDRNSRDYDILLNAVLTANLGDALADPAANLTVLAPNDAAFIALARDLGYEGADEAGAFDAIVSALTTLGEGDPIPVLTNILLYHVMPGANDIRSLITSGSLETLLEGATIATDF